MFFWVNDVIVCSRCKRQPQNQMEFVGDWLFVEDEKWICPSCITREESAVIAAWEVDDVKEAEAFRNEEAKRAEWLDDDEITAEYGDRS